MENKIRISSIHFHFILTKRYSAIYFVYLMFSGRGALLWNENFEDSTGKTYYGEHDLYFAQTYEGNKSGKVPRENGQIFDVAWSPNR
jgi:uncharacterized protein with WD repeat